MIKKLNVVTIDGPSASGKGTLSRGIANRFGLDILDSGLLYRLYAFMANAKINIDDIKDKIRKDISFLIFSFISSILIFALAKNA